MVRDLIVRGFDDKVHSNLGKIANQKGVSINSIVKDAVDKWLKQQQEIPKKHSLVIYSNDESMTGLLKSMDRLAQEANMFRSFCGPPYSPSTELLSKMKWYNGTIMPYLYSGKIQLGKHQTQLQDQTLSQKEIMKYFSTIIDNMANKSLNRQLCCIDLLINDIAKSSFKLALSIEQLYNNNKLPGLMYCAYNTENLLNSEIKNMIELFEMHDQVFILNEDEVYKLHVTKENVHKLFLN